jgi:phosphoglycerate dehydrogenase-like enzyme
MLVWLADRPERKSLTVPADVETTTVPRHPREHPDLGRVEALVPPYGNRDVLAAIAEMDSLRLVQTLESGVDWLLPHVPLHVTVCNSRGVHDAAVAEWVVGAIVAMRRRLPEHFQAQAEGRWRDIVAGGEWRAPYAGDVEGATVLIVGYGSIGQAVERRLQPFGVRIARVASRRREGVEPAESLPGLIAEADVVVSLLPLTASTDRFFDTALLRAMKRGALFVNAGRGRVVDQEALADALYEGRLRAALDVTYPEPLPPEHRLWSAPGLLLTPHMAGDTPRRFRRSWRLAGEQIQRLLDGAPLVNQVARD